jgi:hypothetical protein
MASEEKQTRQITIKLPQPSPGRAIVVLICVAVLTLIVGLVVSDALGKATPEVKPTPSATATATTTPVPEPTATVEPRPNNAPRSDTEKTFTMPNVTGQNAVAAAELILRSAPSAALQFVDQSGVVVEARTNYTVVATTPAAGDVAKTSGFVTLEVAAP